LKILFFPVLAKYCRWEISNVKMVVASNWQIKQFEIPIIRRPGDRDFTILGTIYAEDFYPGVSLAQGALACNLQRMGRS
jgi:hypothetical protein